MAIKKSELYSSLWKSCDELRGGMDASQYKDYILVFLFIKYISDKYAGDPDALVVVPEGSSFSDLVKLKKDKEIGDKINKHILKPLAEANGLKGVIDLADFNDPDKLGKGQEMVDRLSNLIAIFENPSLNFSKNRAEGDDLLGDAYEYLMRHFATQSGKSKGQFYTPSEVSRVIAKVIGISKATMRSQTLYDPTCGSGSLLLKAADETPGGISVYGQEMDNATKALAVMNMWLHGNPDAEIWQDNTLANPYFKDELGKLKTFDFAVSNPPFSTKAWSNGFDPENDVFQRFTGFGVPPDKNGDYAFLLHLVKSLKSNGKGAIILPHGVLFRGGAEGVIRQNLVRKGYLKGIIGLPANLFYGTGIPACIIVLDKENAASRRGIFIVDASKGFVKDGNKNRLQEQDTHKIVDVFNRQLDVPKYARMVGVAEIEANDYNLNIPRYIDSQEAEDIQDIEAHLLGGIPDRDVEALGNYWQVYPSLESELFVPGERAGYRQLKVEGGAVKDAIFSHPEFIGYAAEIAAVFQSWQDKFTPLLKNLKPGFHPKELVFELSEAILLTFSGKALLDKYAVYQHLMTYWSETMQDDAYLLTADGWEAPVYSVTDKNGKAKKDEWDCDLVPKSLVIRRYFSAEQKAIEQLEADRDECARQLEEMEEEHGGEEGLLEPLKNDKGKIAKADVQKRLRELKKNDPATAEERQVLENWLDGTDLESETNRRIKEKKAALDKLLYRKYKLLTEAEIKTLVVDDKWMTSLRQQVSAEMDSISQRLAQRIRELAERYGTTLPELEKQVNDLTEKVTAHLENMGFVWKEIMA